MGSNGRVRISKKRGIHSLIKTFGSKYYTSPLTKLLRRVKGSPKDDSSFWEHSSVGLEHLPSTELFTVTNFDRMGENVNLRSKRTYQHKQGVTSSNLVVPTNQHRKFLLIALGLRVVGSSPTLPTN